MGAWLLGLHSAVQNTQRLPVWLAATGRLVDFWAGLVISACTLEMSYRHLLKYREDKKEVNAEFFGICQFYVVNQVPHLQFMILEETNTNSF